MRNSRERVLSVVSPKRADVGIRPYERFIFNHHSDGLIM